MSEAFSVEAPVASNDGGESFLGSYSSGAPAKTADALLLHLQEEKVRWMRKREGKVRDKITEDGVVRGHGGAHLFELGKGGRQRKDLISKTRSIF